MKKNFITILFAFLFSQSIFAQQPYIGEIKLFAGNFAPVGYEFCDGRLLSIAENTTLFTLIGNIYGGDGQSTFALPDLRGRVPVGRGQGAGQTNRVLGATAGQESVVLVAGNMPLHNHIAQLMVSNQRATTAIPTSTSAIATSGLVSGRGFRPNLAYTTNAPNTTLQTVTTGNIGTSQPMSLMKPYCAINYIISLSGIFPSSN